MKNWSEQTELLLNWYEAEKRDLPWRNTTNPYHIWISEIMLQQTRVEAVKEYYERFLTALPTIQDLAHVSEDKLLKLWQGLGYYSRAKNLKKAAQTLVDVYDGILPTDYHTLLSLSGIGTYTAGAIASFAFSLPYPAVDGNVMRVMARLMGDTTDITLPQTKKLYTEQMHSLLPADVKKVGAFNQSLIELGAMICIPNGKPRCDLCVLQKFCVSYQKNLLDTIPVRGVKKSKKLEYLNIFFLVHENKIAIRKRPDTGLLSDLFELPNTNQETSIQKTLTNWNISAYQRFTMSPQKHIFTHIIWHMNCYFILCESHQNTDFLWLSKDMIEAEYALPSAFSNIWNDALQNFI